MLWELCSWNGPSELSHLDTRLLDLSTHQPPGGLTLGGVTLVQLLNRDSAARRTGGSRQGTLAFTTARQFGEERIFLGRQETCLSSPTSTYNTVTRNIFSDQHFKHFLFPKTQDVFAIKKRVVWWSRSTLGLEARDLSTNPSPII